MRLLLVLHRWGGAALAAVLLMWFASGIVMLYRGYPSVTQADRLQRAPALVPAQVRLSAEEAFTRHGRRPPVHALLTTFDGRPIYVGDDTLVYADDGTEQRTIEGAMVERAAVAWSGQPIDRATIETIHAVDQWTLSSGLRSLRPLFKYTWPDGQQVYVHGETAEVVQYTTIASRAWAYVGAIPHWLYVPALRTLDARWMSFMTWVALSGGVVAVAGVAIALYRLSPRRRYRRQGKPAVLPYRGWMRWHTVLGLVVGLTAVTWTFSGLLSLEVFDLDRRLTALVVGAEVEDQVATDAWRRMDALLLDRALPLAAYAQKPPAVALASLGAFAPKELEYASLGGRPVYVATNGAGDTRVVPIDGEAFASLDARRLAQRLQTAAGHLAQIDVIDTFDAYYRDRRGALPLPAIRVRLHDAVGSRYYISPRTATLVSSYSSREWVSRWLYHGLHSLDFPWLYARRPLWDVVVLTLLMGGAALCGTSLVLAWRVMGRTLAAWSSSVPLPSGRRRSLMGA